MHHQLTCVWSTGCSEDDTIGDLKKLVAAQTGTRPEKIRIQKWYNVYKDHITLADYEIHDGMGARQRLNQRSASAVFLPSRGPANSCGAVCRPGAVLQLGALPAACHGLWQVRL